MPPNETDLCYLSATEALKCFHSGQLSPVELLAAVIKRTELIDKTVNPLADKYFDDALLRAKEAEERYRQGNARPLEGIPLLVKDSSAIEGTRATNGSLLYADSIDQHTDPCVQRLMDAGANFFARSTCPEFCWLFTCHSRLWGVTRNPWRLDVTPGGSSGGSAAALAAGATIIATGGDSTGSIRQPAAQCGVVGYKSPFGRNPLAAEKSFDPYVNAGPMTRSVSDAALMQNIMSGPHPLDHNSLPDSVTLPLKVDDIRGMKIACSIDLGHYIVDKDVRRETLATLDALRAAGAEVNVVEIDWASEAIKLGHMNQEFILAGSLHDAIKNHADKLSDYVPELYATASAVTADDFRNSLTVAGEIWHNHLGPLFQQYDAFITPGVSYPEVPAENKQQDIITVNNCNITDTDTAMTVLFNMFSRCPVLSVPAGFTDQGLPVGIQIAGRPYDDVTAFRIAYAIEHHRPWAKRRPDL